MNINFHDVLNFCLIGLASWLGFWLLNHNDAHDEMSMEMGRMSQEISEVRYDVNSFEVGLRSTERDIQVAQVNLAEINTHMLHTNVMLERIMDYIEAENERARNQQAQPVSTIIEKPSQVPVD